VSSTSRSFPSPIVPLGREILVYLCGKISKSDWRHKIVLGLRYESGDPDSWERARYDDAFDLPTITRGFTCCGPWVIGCDHGCVHGRGTHGTEGGGCLPFGEQDRTDVFQISLARIRRADAVFAYIDRPDAHGSLVEIGYAKQHSKLVFVGFPRTKTRWREDMWFCAQADDYDPGGHVGSVEELWTKFCLLVGRAYWRKRR
jgi:hypothetical protein